MSTGLFHFRAALDLLDQDWGGPKGHAAGNWAAMVKRVRRSSGTVIISHEILAPAKPEHIARLRRDLDGCEIHVVYSARDLARQAPAGWQESIKQGRRWSYRRYLSRVRAGTPWFARAFDLPAVLSQWGTGLPPDHVHVVTVPQADAVAADPDLLWRRFCEAFGIDPAWAPHESHRSNASLGSAETQVLRRLNQRLSRATRRDASYDDLILGMLAGDTLAGSRSRPILLPPKFHDWAIERGEAWIRVARGERGRGDRRRRRPAARAAGRGLPAPRPGPSQAAARGRSRRAGRDDPRGGVPARPRLPPCAVGCGALRENRRR